MRSSPQVGFSLAISTISFCNSAGTRGRLRGFDFHLQNSREPFRCHRMKVSGWTIVRARRHANRRESSTRVSRLASLARRALRNWRCTRSTWCYVRTRCPIFVQRTTVREHLYNYCATKNATVFQTVAGGHTPFF